jgi:hypothetical protein
VDGDFGDLGADLERVGEHLTSHGLPDLLGGAEEDLEQVTAADDVDEPVLFVDHRESFDVVSRHQPDGLRQGRLRGTVTAGADTSPPAVRARTWQAPWLTASQVRPVDRSEGPSVSAVCAVSRPSKPPKLA